MRVLAGLALFVLSFWAPGQEVRLQPQHEVQVRLVLVDVLATKGGEFFPELKKEDFRIFENGKEVPVNSCDLIVLGKSEVPQSIEEKAAVPIVPQKKRLAVLYDGINSWGQEFRKAADEISQELVNLSKSDLDVMILFLDAQKGLRTIQPFTDQEELIRESARKAAGKAFVPSLELID